MQAALWHATAGLQAAILLAWCQLLHHRERRIHVCPQLQSGHTDLQAALPQQVRSAGPALLSDQSKRADVKQRQRGSSMLPATQLQWPSTVLAGRYRVESVRCTELNQRGRAKQEMPDISAHTQLLAVMPKP